MYNMWKAFHTEGKLEVSSAHPLETSRYVEVIMFMVLSCLIVFMREYILERNHIWKAIIQKGILEVSSAHPLETSRYVEVIMLMVSSCLCSWENTCWRETIFGKPSFRRETGSPISSPTGNQPICWSNNVHGLVMLVFMREYILERNHILKAIIHKGNCLINLPTGNQPICWDKTCFCVQHVEGNSHRKRVACRGTRNKGDSSFFSEHEEFKPKYPIESLTLYSIGYF